MLLNTPGLPFLFLLSPSNLIKFPVTSSWSHYFYDAIILMPNILWVLAQWCLPFFASSISFISLLANNTPEDDSVLSILSLQIIIAYRSSCISFKYLQFGINLPSDFKHELGMPCHILYCVIGPAWWRASNSPPNYVLVGVKALEALL